MINNKEVVDLKSIDGIRTEWRDRLYTRYSNERQRDHAWNWRTGNTSLHDPVTNVLRPITILAGTSSPVLYASMSDVLGGVFDSLPWNRLNLVEIEMTLASQQKYIGDTADSLGVLHNSIQVYSRHKCHTIPVPKMFSNWTLNHNEHEVIKITSPSPLHALGSGTKEMVLLRHSRRWEMPLLGHYGLNGTETLSLPRNTSTETGVA
jgi:hypothetical protein